MKKYSFIKFYFFLFFFIKIIGCGLKVNVHYKNYDSHLHNRNFKQADSYVKSQKENFYGKENRLLYYLDRGSILHLDKQYKKSNQFFDKAKIVAEELWTESISANALALATTDNALPYQGEDFEKVYIHFLKTLNYLQMNQYSSARVEARQIYILLDLLNTKYKENSNTYKDDAFAHFLAGKILETESGYTSLNAAWIEYKKALDIYKNDFKYYKVRTP